MSSNIIAKVVLLGDGRVGKTSIRRRFMGEGFTAQHLMTLGTDFSNKRGEIEIDDQKIEYTLQIWDIAGQNSFLSIRKRFLTHAAGIIAVFDVTNKESFQSLEKWIKEVWAVNNDVTKPILVMGNKTDLINQKEIEESSAAKFCEELLARNPTIRSLDYIETSALTGENIIEGFEMITKSIYSQ